MESTDSKRDKKIRNQKYDTSSYRQQNRIRIKIQDWIVYTQGLGSSKHLQRKALTLGGVWHAHNTTIHYSLVRGSTTEWGLQGFRRRQVELLWAIPLEKPYSEIKE